MVKNLVIVTDTDTTDPVANATVTLSGNDELAIGLPNVHLLDYNDQTTVTVLLSEAETPETPVHSNRKKVNIFAPTTCNAERERLCPHEGVAAAQRPFHQRIDPFFDYWIGGQGVFHRGGITGYRELNVIDNNLN